MVINAIIDLDNGELLEATGKHRISALDIQGSETAELKFTFYKNGSAVTDNSVVSGAVIDFGVKADANYTGTSYLIYHDTFSASSDGLTYSATPTWATSEVETALGNESSVKLHGQVKVVISGITYYSQVFEVEIHNNVIQAAGTTNSVIFPRLIQSASDPTVNDDSLDGYGVSSLWLNTSTNAVHVLMDNTAGAAVWAGFLGLTNGQLANNLVFNDGIKAIFGTASDGIELYHQSNHSYLADTGTGALKILGSQIEINNAANSENIATFTQDGGAALFFNNSKKIESTNLGCTISGKLVVNGDLEVSTSGSITHFQSTTTQIDDPVLRLGENATNDNFDRGVEFLYNDGSAKVGFFGYDDSEDAFTFLTDATNNSEVFSGTLGNLKVKTVYFADGTEAAPSVRFNLDSDTGIFRPTANNIAITAGGSEVVRFDDNLKTTTKGAVRVNGSTTEGIVIASSSSASQGLKIFNNSSTDDASIINHYSGNLIFGTANTEAARFDSSGRLITPNNVGIGTVTDPSYPLVIRKPGDGVKLDITDGVDANFRVAVNGAVTEIGPSTATAAFMAGGAERMRLNSTGLGIGGTPASKLQCTTVDAVNTFTMHRDGSNNGTNTALNRIQFAQDFDGTQSDFGRIDLTSNASSLRTDLKFYVKSTAGTEKLGLNIHGTVDQGARVGVGEVAIPLAPLHVQGTALSGYVSGDVNADTIAIIENDDNARLAIVAADLCDLLFGDAADQDVGRIRYNHSANSLALFTNGSEQMRIDSSGNVGIGTTSPTVKTHIKDTSAGAGVVLRIENDGASGAAQLDLKNDVQSWLINTRTDDHFSVYNNTLATTPFLINTSGNVGIGTTSPDSLCHIQNTVAAGTDNFQINLQNLTTATNSKVGVGFRTNNQTGANWDGAGIQALNNGVDGKAHLSFGSVLNASFTEAMRIDSSGFVGINTTSFTNLLSVVGKSDDQTSVAKITRSHASASNDTYTLDVDSSSHTSNMTAGGAFSVKVNSGKAFKINGNGDIFQNYINYTDESNYEALKISAESDHILFNTSSIGSFSSNQRAIKFKTNGTDLLTFDGASSSIKIPNDVQLRIGGGNDIRIVSESSVNRFNFYNHDTDFRSLSDDKDITFKTTTGGTTSEAVRITGAGRLGVGTGSTVDQLLHIKDDSAANDLIRLRVQGGATAGHADFGVQSGYARIFANSTLSYATSGSQHFFYTSGTVRQTVNNNGVGINTTAPSANADLTLENGALAIKETTTPTADADYGKIYCKSDNKLYFQDGAGTEHEIAFA